MNTLLLSAILLCAAPSSAGPTEGKPAADEVRYPAKPGPRDFILDEAKLLTSDDAAAVKTLCDEALTKKRAPIIVVTIPSLADYGARGWPIERYAMNLMSEWGIGWEDWNYGMLLLVSPGDRKARIELGGSWARRKDDDAKRLMVEKIIPKFKQGDYSKGILAGVQGLHDVALDAVPARTVRTAPVGPAPNPVPPTPQHYTFPDSLPNPSVRVSSPGAGCFPAWLSGVGVIILIIGGIIALSMISRAMGGGVSSWGNSGPGTYGGGYYNRGYGRGSGFGASFGGGMLGGALGSILADQYNRRSSSSYQDNSPSYSPPSSSDSGGSSSSSSSDSSFGGGSFGGGFSGGGGATGEW